MICKNCPEGRRYANGSVNCIMYGIIIREDHECIRTGGKKHERYAGDPGDSKSGAELQEDGWELIDSLPDVF